jgi:conjugal transfer pilus assembly protein TraW
MATCRIFASAALLLLLTGPALAQQVLPRDGRVYPITEPDMLEELRAKAATVDWSKVVNKDKQKEKIKTFKPENLISLPPAKEDRSYLVDMTYTLDVDMPDGKGGVLYPKGYSFNPLDFAPLRGKLIVIDGSDPRQVAWFDKSVYRDDLNVKLLLTGGSYYQLMEKFRRPVFYYMQPMSIRLQVEAVPAVVEQAGKMIRVTEVGLEKRKS